jgi:hypothetical protein
MHTPQISAYGYSFIYLIVSKTYSPDNIFQINVMLFHHLFSIISGKKCMNVVLHIAIVVGERYCATWEDCAENINAFYGTAA